MSDLLFIGLNGYAGSGKDTVAKMLKVILSHNWTSCDYAWGYYKQHYSNDNGIQYATLSNLDKDNDVVYTIAFADQLKQMCSAMFGVPLDMFYYNKGNCWVNINGDFRFTQIKPNDESIITSQQYYENGEHYIGSPDKYWMSLREILIYVGTYLCQNFINYNIFVNIVNNKINEAKFNTSTLEYALVTDVRFTHELDYIKQHNGILINIVRDSVEQMDNIAEHDLDEVSDYTFTIFNNGTYEDLFHDVWNLVKHNVVFDNNTIHLTSRDNIHNYLRCINETPEYKEFTLSMELPVARISKHEGEITMIDPTGGPYIAVGNIIPNTDLFVTEIKLDIVLGWVIKTRV